MVTIVVLLILAIVTINMIVGEDGLIGQAQSRKDKQENLIASSEENMYQLAQEYANMMVEQKITLEETKQDSMLTKEENTELTIGDDTVWIPAGFKVHTDSATVVDEGIVITDGTNEFVWVPVSETSYNNMFADGTVALSGSTNVTSSYYSKLRVTATKDTYVPAIVSSGAYAPAEGETTTGPREPDLVTDYDEDTTNEYYKQAGFSSAKAMAEGFVDDYKAMRESIKTYGGFYIGRYELTGTVDSPTVQAGAVLDAGSSEAKNWYGLYKACRNVVIGNEHAVTTMIWGCQWDETMNWLKNTKFKNNPDAVDTDSSSWGNYKDYNTTNGYEEGNEKYVAEAGTIQNTGFSAHWSANKIYDLAGNYYDFTQEAYYTGSRILRGRPLQWYRFWLAKFDPCQLHCLRCQFRQFGSFHTLYTVTLSPVTNAYGVCGKRDNWETVNNLRVS